MRSRRTGLLLAGLVCIVLSLAIGSPLQGADFRIETKIFVGDQPEPVSQNLTLFHRGVVYDFLTAPAQIAIFRHSVTSEEGRFILLDPRRQLRSEISSDQIMAFLNGLKAWAAAQDDPLLKFAADPDFKEAIIPASRRFVGT